MLGVPEQPHRLAVSYTQVMILCHYDMIPNKKHSTLKSDIGLSKVPFIKYLDSGVAPVAVHLGAAELHTIVDFHKVNAIWKSTTRVLEKNLVTYQNIFPQKKKLIFFSPPNFHFGEDQKNATRLRRVLK